MVSRRRFARIARLAAFALIVATAVTRPGAVSGQAASVEAIKLAQAGQKALDERRFGDALTAFTEAAKLAPRDTSLMFGVGLSYFLLGRTAEAEQQLLRVLKTEPAFKEASLLLGEVQYRSGRIEEAVTTYQTALKYAPSDKDLLQKIAQWSGEARVESRFGETRGVHFRVLFEGPVDQALARRAVELLETAYMRVGDALAFYPTKTIDVVLYTQQQFSDITRSPAWAAGMFDGRIRVPVKGALNQGAELERVLAHEYVHALIAGVSARTLPAWVNEGLAVMFEPNGLEEAEQIRRRVEQRPTLPELHAGFGPLPAGQARLAYAESAVAVRAMLDLRGPSAVVMLLKDVGSGTPFINAFHQRIGMRYEEFQRIVAAR